MNSFSFSTKATTLERLAPLVNKARFCAQTVISVNDWTDDATRIIEQIRAAHGDVSLAVRSSCLAEDTHDESAAGVHFSEINVASEPASLTKAINAVIDSYGEPKNDDQVLVQPMVEDVAISGVVMTRDLNTGGPYFVINYDDYSGRTDTVTGGGESKTILVHRSKSDALHSERFRKLIDCICEIERATGSEELDIEFCIDADDRVFILQVRPLAARKNWTRFSNDGVDHALDRIRAQIRTALKPVDGLAGKTTVFGEMPDWNPAEMIGNTPRPLALSLYRHLITDDVWARARAEMGYRPVNAPLMTDFHGHPFIDVRLSFNSFLPAGIADAFADDLVNFQLAALRDNRELHDKIEFEIAVTCCDFNFARDRDRLRGAGFHPSDIGDLEARLAALTNRLLKNYKADIEANLSLARGLLARPPGGEGESSLTELPDMLQSCRDAGTLPFSKLARHGFIAVQFLKSLVARGAFDEDDAESFMRSINTVATDLVCDMHALAGAEISLESFLAKHGHLRPGTYDILSPRYDERPDLYLGGGGAAPPAHQPFQASARQSAAINRLLSETGYDIDADALLDYMVSAIKAREEAKFCFSRRISDGLATVAAWSRSQGLSADDVSYLGINDLLERNPPDWRRRIAENKSAFDVTRVIRLPHLIFEPEDIDVVRMPLGHPTFITKQAVTAAGRVLDTASSRDITGKIVLIDHADPGFDWIFSHAIAGLITRYGGANSHMAIRCAEFSLPAAIGCGARIFDNLSKAPVIELNCGAHTVRPARG